MGNRLIQWHIAVDHSPATTYADQVIEIIDAFRATPLEYRPSVIWVDPAGLGLCVLDSLDAAGLPVRAVDHRAACEVRIGPETDRGDQK